MPGTHAQSLQPGRVCATPRAVAVDVQHPGLSQLATGAVVYGQVQDLPVAAPRIRMEVVRVDAEGIGLRFIDL